METIAERSIENHLLDLIAEWKADLFDLNFKDVDGWNDGNRVVASAQYAYIKFGLILEKIRNECAYKYCEDKLKTFAQFCRQKLKLTVWQANSYIEAADTAMYLADSGFEILPKNYSQAAVLTKAKKLETGYYQDHPVLEQIWGTLVANTNFFCSNPHFRSRLRVVSRSSSHILRAIFFDLSQILMLHK